MRIAVIGASQGIGHELLKMALEEGHEVAALLRIPSMLSISNSRLKMVEGDILDQASVTAVTAGQDAV